MICGALCKNISEVGGFCVVFVDTCIVYVCLPSCSVRRTEAVAEEFGSCCTVNQSVSPSLALGALQAVNRL